tara:strand:- start:13 stop:273 length:261 start_codon:yes stop_codon:yes gene_type:complete
MLASNIIERPIKKNYRKWWSSPIETISGYRVDNKNKNRIITNGMYVKDFYNRLTNILKKKGYEIDNENKLKNEVATFIYNLSDDDI